MSAHSLDLWLDGKFAGKLRRGANDQVEFAYEIDYIKDRPTPLSVSMPTSIRAHGPRTVMPWLSNLLPDAEEVRDRWAAKFAERKTDPFTLLRHMGQDAPGSVQVVPEGIQPSQAGVDTAISRARIAKRVGEIIHDPNHWVDDNDEDQSRFSLGGNQGKFALAKINGKWFEPNGRTPSTHIIKPGMSSTGGFSNTEAQAAEFITMRTAHALHIPTAMVEIEEFDGLYTFVTQRYDRVEMPDETITRVHQEDFCQSLSLFPSRKYEVDGGPGMVDMAAVIDEHTSARWRHESKRTLASLFAFNLLTAGVDAHAKNHSLLLSGSSARLAPAYDLISAHGLWDADRIKYKSSAAVAYGKERRYKNIGGRNIARAADSMGVNRSEFRDILESMSISLLQALENATSELPPELVTDRIKRMPERIAEFASSLVSRIGTNDLNDTPPYNPHPTAYTGVGRQEVWIAGSYRNGSWQLGHYRTQPSR